MELTLNIYNTRLCKKGDIAREAKAQDIELSTGVCTDVLNIIQIDLFEGGLSALSTESQFDIILGIVKDGLPFFIDLMKEIFDVSDAEMKNTKLSDIAKVVFAIVKYSMKELAPFAKQKN